MHHKSHTQKARAETRLPPEEDPEFQIAPMIDILLVLLVFFMSISSTEVLQTNDKVRLPVAKDGKDANNV
jgi:biopolymer transport protein ExbD